MRDTDEYVCEVCGNSIPASQVDRALTGTKGRVIVTVRVLCDRAEHHEQQFEMRRVA